MYKYRGLSISDAHRIAISTEKLLSGIEYVEEGEYMSHQIDFERCIFYIFVIECDSIFEYHINISNGFTTKYPVIQKNNR